MSKKMSTSRKGRKCKFHGCKQVLSIYNHEAYCHVHSSFSTNKQALQRPVSIKKDL